MKGYKKYFLEVIAGHFPDEVSTIINEIDYTFETIKPDISFAPASSNPMDRRLTIAAYMLSFIIVLDKRGVDYQLIRSLLLEITKNFVQPENRFQQWVKKIPPMLIRMPFVELLLKKLDKKLSVAANPDGFIARILTDKKETLGFGYGIDILQCGICKLFAKHNCQRFAPILCEVDYITSSLAGLKLIRTGTIANGASCCDFRFSKQAAGAGNRQ